MIIKLEMEPKYEQTLKDLGSMGNRVRKACTRGLRKGAGQAAGHVVRNYLSGQTLNRRTGTLARSVDSWMPSVDEAVIGVRPGAAANKYAWLLGPETKTITPKRGKFLAIPIGENLTGAGVARFSSPRQVADGFFVRTGGKLLFGYKNGTRGRFRALFALVKSVTIHGSDALADGVTESVDDMTKEIQNEIDRETGK